LRPTSKYVSLLGISGALYLSVFEHPAKKWKGTEMQADKEAEDTDHNQVMATITNRQNPEQSVKIKYLRAENAFVTSGIQAYLGMKEILVPVHLVAADFQLIGAIISAILERISLARETNASFAFANRFEVLGRTYRLAESGEYMKLEWE
jgi:hypothetical protein